MRKIKDKGKYTEQKELEELFQQVKIHLEEKNTALKLIYDIYSCFLRDDFVFYFVGYPCWEAYDHKSPKIEDIDFITSVEMDDGFEAPALYSSLYHLKTAIPAIKKGSFIYSINAEELLNFMKKNQYPCMILNPDAAGMLIRCEDLNNALERKKDNEKIY